MAKGTGLIGNFKGKVGNTVGYKLSASNNGQTQGIRVYQPIVKNPKTAAQAEQRAKLLAVNATYRALKMVIDRGNEGLPYGNKSRLAWLKGALKAQNMPWYEKGSIVTLPVGCPLTKGSLAGLAYQAGEDQISISVPGVTQGADVSTVGKVSTLIKAGYPTVQDGDQVTIVKAGEYNDILTAEVTSFVIDTTSAEALTGVSADAGKLVFEAEGSCVAGAVILSREGSNGEHLRSTTSLKISADVLASAPYDDDSKDAAIASYRASAASNTDWAEESIQ